MDRQFTRRSFLKTSAAAGAFAGVSTGALGSPWLARTQDQAEKSLKILILGGTGFIGPHIVNAARGRGHEVTLFNRGRTNSDLFPDLETLHGNRDPKIGDGLTALEGREWDAVVDTSGYVPRIVGASAELLSKNVGHYVFISSISAYGDPSKLNMSEEDPVDTIEDTDTEEVDMRTYGPLKALCEQAVDKAMNGRVSNIRPGYIIGPRDPYDRLTYWVVRVDRGGEVLSPGASGDPVQLIDARDLADFVVTSVESKHKGVYNAVGPQRELSMGELLTSCWAATGGDAEFTWVGSDFIESNQLQVPLWVSPTGDYRGFGGVNNEKAIAAGMTYRPLAQTARDTLDWFNGESSERQTRLLSFIGSGREQELLGKFRGE